MTEAESDRLSAENTALRQLVQDQAHLIERLQQRIEEVEGRLSHESHNSSKPPASDGLRKTTMSLRGRRGKKPGGQAGHPGTTLRRVSTSDEVVVLHPRTCPPCQTALHQVAATGCERRQGVDVPPVSMHVTEYQAAQVRCPHGHHTVTNPFPEAVTAPMPDGPQVQALAVSFLYRQFLPYQRTAEVLHDLYHCPIAVGTCSKPLSNEPRQKRRLSRGCRPARSWPMMKPACGWRDTCTGSMSAAPTRIPDAPETGQSRHGGDWHFTHLSRQPGA